MPKPSEREPELLSHPLVRRVASEISLRQMFGPGERLLVGVSGGVDSMVLLEVLRLLAPAHCWKLAVAHFNHQLRGRSSNADERLVVRTARRMRLPIAVAHGAVRDYAAQTGVSIEMAARTLRHQFLATTARRRRMHKIVLAHHAGDQAELFFLRLMRGASPEGLSGMKPVSASPVDSGLQVVRPLLLVERKSIEDFADVGRVEFREDASNRSKSVLRNRVRHELLPLLKQYHPGIHQNVARLMEIARAESDFVSSAAKVWLAGGQKNFLKLHEAVQRRCIAEQLIKLGIAPEFDLVERLRTIGQMQVTGPANLRLSLDAHSGVVKATQEAQTAFRSDKTAVEIGKPGLVAFSGLRISWELLQGNRIGKSRPGYEVFDAEAVGPKVVLRHWQPGDRFQPIGMQQPVKLQDLLTNLKVPRARRMELALAEDTRGRIFWVEGCRISDLHKVTEGTKWRVKWEWKRPSLGLRGVR